MAHPPSVSGETKPPIRESVWMRKRQVLIAAAIAALLQCISALPPSQPQTVHAVGVDRLHQYPGTYQWAPGAFLYLQLWSEFTGTNQLVAFDESGEVRTLFPTEPDRFFAGPGAALSNSVEARIQFHRDSAGKVLSLSWERDGAPTRVARRVEIEKRQDVQFSNGEVRLAGSLIT